MHWYSQVIFSENLKVMPLYSTLTDLILVSLVYFKSVCQHSIGLHDFAELVQHAKARTTNLF